MSHGYSFIMYWASNKEWYRINEEEDRFELTEQAPEKARRSFLLYTLFNNLPDNNSDEHAIEQLLVQIMQMSDEEIVELIEKTTAEKEH